MFFQDLLDPLKVLSFYNYEVPGVGRVVRGTDTVHAREEIGVLAAEVPRV